MAVIAAPLIASSLGATGAVAAGVAVAAGAYIDQRYLYPAIFPPDDIIGPRINDLRTTSADEGATFSRVFGSAVRVVGTVLWASPLIEKRDEQNAGKGGSGGSSIVYSYSAYIAIGFAERGELNTEALQPGGIELLFANGTQVWDRDPDVNLQGVSVSVSEVRALYDYSTGTAVVTRYEMTLDSDFGSGGPDLTVFAAGKEIVLSGFTGAAVGNNSASFPTRPIRVLSYKFGSGAFLGHVYLTVRRDFISGGNFSVGTNPHTINLFQSAPRFSQNHMDADPVFFEGREDQPAWNRIVSYEGASETSAYRGIAFAGLEKLQLLDWGNVVPTSFEAVVSGQGDITTGEIIEQVCLERGLPASRLDVSLCTDIVTGYAYRGPTNGITVLQPILVAYDLIPQERDEVLHFFPRDQAPVVIVAEDDLGTFVPQAGKSPRKIRKLDVDDVDIPTELTLVYQDAQRHYQRGAQIARISNRKSLVSDTITLDLVLEPAAARKMCERILRRAYQNTRRFEFHLPGDYIGVVRESTIVETTEDGIDYRILVDKVDIGENYQMRCEGVDEDVRHAVQFEDADTGLGVEEFANGRSSFGAVSSPGLVLLEVMDNFCLDDAHTLIQGYYVCGRMSQSERPLKDAAVMMSSDGGTTYNRVATLTRSAIMGVVHTSPSTTASTTDWDDASAMVIDLYGDEGLESVTDLQCDSGMNLACVGNELIGFANATLVGVYGTYTRWSVTRLRRGLQGTELDIASHQDGERFVFLSGPGIEFVPMNQVASGTERLFKAVPGGAYLEEVEPQAVTLIGATVRPLAPVHPTATRNGSNDVTVGFTRRTRSVYSPFSGLPLPQHENRVAYVVELMEQADPATLSASLSQATTDDVITLGSAFTAADQTTAGYTPGDPVNVNIYATSNVLAEGRRLEAVI